MQKVVFLTKTGMIHAPENMTTAEAQEWAKTQPDSVFQWNAPNTVAFSKELVEKMAKLTTTDEVPVRVCAVFRVQDGMDVEVYPAHYAVMVPAEMAAPEASNAALEKFVIEKLQKAAVLTYMADYANIRRTTCNGYCWGDFMGLFESLPDIGVFRAPDFPWEKMPTSCKREVSLELNHDAYPEEDVELPTATLVFTDKAGVQHELGAVEYGAIDGEVYFTPEPSKEGTWELVFECGIRSPVAMSEDDPNYDCGLFFAEA